MANNQKKVLDQESVGYVLLSTIFRDVSAVLIKEDGSEEKFLNEMGVKNKVGHLISNINKEIIEKHGLDVTHLLKELTIEYYFENDQLFLKYQFVNLWNNFRIIGSWHHNVACKKVQRDSMGYCKCICFSY